MRPEPVILAFDTSAAHCAAALLRGERCLAAAREEMTRGQAERLLPLLEEVLARGAVGWRDLDALAVGTGPGNFTGIRISVAAARGLALALAIPAIGISLFQAAAEAAAISDGPVVLPAPRGAAYVQDVADGVPFGPPRLIDADGVTPPATLLPEADLAEILGRIAARQLASALPPTLPRPAPLYVRPADAAPSSAIVPPILPEPS